MSTRFHVTSVLNRESILEHGLDYSRMGAARGIAGSHRPEQPGTFLARDDPETDFFVRINNTGGPVDVWQVDDVDETQLREMNGYQWLPGTIPPARVVLIRKDIPPVPWD